MLPMFSQNLTLQEAFETIAQMNEEPKRMEFDGAFCRKSVEEMIHQKKNRVTKCSRLLNPDKAFKS